MSFFSLIDEGVLVKDQFVVDTCIENTLEHDDVSNDFTGHERVLHFLVGDEVVKPVLAEFWDAAHLKEVGGFDVTANWWLISLSASE